jgi:pyruvate formate lyase activating enzyme
MDSKAHQELTGVPNERILENTRHLGAMNFPVLIRVPLIPEFNDTEENAESLGKFLKKINLVKVDLMPYHTMGLSKTKALGREYKPFGDHHPASTTPAVDRTVSILKKYGLQVTVQQST